MKRFIAFFLTLILLSGISGAVAATEEEAPSMSPERKEFKTIFEEMQADFDALTDDQKEQVYSIGDKITAQKIALVEKYIQFGIVSEDEGEEFIQKLNAHNEKLKSEGKMIGGFFPPPPLPLPNDG